MFFNYNPSNSTVYRDVVVQTGPLVLVNTRSSQDVNSVVSKSYFPHPVKSESFFPDLVDVDSVKTNSNSTDLVEIDSNFNFPDLEAINGLKSESYFPDLVHSPNKDFFDIVDTDVLSNYLENPANFVVEVKTFEDILFYLITPTEFLSIEPVMIIVRDLLALAH
jgi:hypothetical protein